jgi:hypothetical protein
MVRRRRRRRARSVQQNATSDQLSARSHSKQPKTTQQQQLTNSFPLARTRSQITADRLERGKQNTPTEGKPTVWGIACKYERVLVCDTPRPCLVLAKRRAASRLAVIKKSISLRPSRSRSSSQLHRLMFFHCCCLSLSNFGKQYCAPPCVTRTLIQAEEHGAILSRLIEIDRELGRDQNEESNKGASQDSGVLAAPVNKADGSFGGLRADGWLPIATSGTMSAISREHEIEPKRVLTKKWNSNLAIGG